LPPLSADRKRLQRRSLPPSYSFRRVVTHLDAATIDYMPRFSVPFGRRKSTADNLENASPIAEPSFRVLERSEVTPGKSFDGGARLGTRTHTVPIVPKTSGSDMIVDDNIFADLKSNRCVTCPSFPHLSPPAPREENLFSAALAILYVTS
jgi:hypothetical protein